MEERRIGGSPIPDTKIQGINQQQLHGLDILSKFGWKLVCVRKANDLNPAVILENRQNGILGTLETDGGFTGVGYLSLSPCWPLLATC
ncbi:MAG: hypothetical protein JAY97_20815 [Candidatus Thiodiazotropha sp. 'RUGA']|nr:hypothetical protein [Candidatus Thiodiazotropha sp. 'RUGA']